MVACGGDPEAIPTRTCHADGGKARTAGRSRGCLPGSSPTTVRRTRVQGLWERTPGGSCQAGMDPESAVPVRERAAGMNLGL